MEIPINKFHHHLYTVSTFGKFKTQIHDGPWGCGKTTSTCYGLGLVSKCFQNIGVTSLTIICAGKTQAAAKKNIGASLKGLFGDDFKYTQSTKDDGLTKDAKLFGQNLIFVGLNDSSAEEKFRGVSEVFCILHDECTLQTEDQYLYLDGRLRGTYKKAKEAVRNIEDINSLEYLVLHDIKYGFYVGTCNPDSPEHFMKKLIDGGKVAHLKWNMDDACWDGADEYYAERLAKYEVGSLHYNRYLLGEWTGAEGMVFSSFNKLRNVLNSTEVDADLYQFDRVILGVDYGSNHTTAILLIGVSDGNYIVIKEYGFRNTAPSDIVYEIKKIYDYVEDQGARINALYIDPAAKALKDELMKQKINYVNAMNEHSAGIGCVNSKLNIGELLVFDICTKLIAEIFSYIYKGTKNGKDEVVKINDDYCDALRYAVYTDSQLHP